MEFDGPRAFQWIEIDGNSLVHDLRLSRKTSRETQLSRVMEHQGDGVNLQSVVTWKTSVGQLQPVTRDESVGYRRTWMARRSGQLAEIPVGYTSAYSRTPGRRGKVLIRGCSAPDVGRVCRNVLMADVTDITDVSIGDEVVLIGRLGDDEIPVEEIASLSDTIRNESLTRLSPGISCSAV